MVTVHRVTEQVFRRDAEANLVAALRAANKVIISKFSRESEDR